TVRGEAVVPATPDEVRLSLSVEATEKSPERAQVEVARRSEALDAVLDGLGIAKERRATQGLSVQEQREYEHSRWVNKGFKATNRVVVRLEDPSPLGSLIRQATEAAEARVDGPWWWVALDNPARTQACTDAAAEARRKAEAYAAALGASLGPAVRVTEPGLVDRHEVFVAAQAPAPMAVRGGGAPPPQIEVEAADLDVAAAVEVTFTLE
ncbi:hypothetical protein B7486_61970, partial [cyanobacterium TDX16]